MRPRLPPRSLPPPEARARHSEREAVGTLWRRIVALSLAGLFLAELAVMLLLRWVDVPWTLAASAMDAALLAVIVSPGLYFVVLRPVGRLAASLAAASADARFRAVVDASGDAIVVGDRRGRVLYANPAAGAMLGYGEDELEGTEIGAIVPEDLRERHARGLRRYAETGEGSAVGHGPVKTQARAKDGTLVPVELTLSAPSLREEGLIVGVIRDLRPRQRLDLYEAVLPTCCVCGRVRDGADQDTGVARWDSLEAYVQRRSALRMSHTFCPDCVVTYRREHGLPERSAARDSGPARTG